MANPNADYRENCDRAIYITGKIGQQLVDRLSPLINKFRLASPDPITIYIDSPGGSIPAAETIRELATAPNPDGKCCRLITVVTGTASSAASDLLALGDYSIAYAHAQILYHGSRSSAGDALTVEGATSLASSLRQTNEFFSVRLARHAFPRVVLRLTQFKDEMNKYRAEQIPGPKAIAPFIKALSDNLSGENSGMLWRAHEQQDRIAALTSAVGQYLKRFKNRKSWDDSRWQVELFKAILGYKLRVHRAESWQLTDGGLDEVSEDFNILWDFHFGTQKRNLRRWLRTHGAIFLTDAQRDEYRNDWEGKKDEKEILEWLRENSEAKIQRVWYLVVSICRLFQSYDFDLTPKEAYWLGLVDEVPGSQLPSLREAVESLNDTDTPSPA